MFFLKRQDHSKENDVFCAVALISSKDGRKTCLRLVVKGGWYVLFQPRSAQELQATKGFD